MVESLIILHERNSIKSRLWDKKPLVCFFSSNLRTASKEGLKW